MLDFALLSRFFRLPWLVVCCLALAACSAVSPQVSYDYDPSADFIGLKQFAWAEPAAQRLADDPLLNNSLLDDRIKSVIEHQLLLKGIRRIDEGAPDFRVAYHVLTRKHGMAMPGAYPYGPFYPYGMGFGYGRYPGYYGAWDMPGGYWQEYETRSLIVDFINPATGKQIWRGILDDALDFTGDPSEQKYRLDAKVQYLFRKFPPGSAP